MAEVYFLKNNLYHRLVSHSAMTIPITQDVPMIWKNDLTDTIRDIFILQRINFRLI